MVGQIFLGEGERLDGRDALAGLNGRDTIKQSETHGDSIQISNGRSIGNQRCPTTAGNTPHDRFHKTARLTAVPDRTAPKFCHAAARAVSTWE